MSGNVPVNVQNDIQTLTQGDWSTLTPGEGGVHSLRAAVLNLNEDQVLMNLLKKVFEQKIKSQCKFISDVQILTFQPNVPNHMSRIILDNMGIGSEILEVERKGVWSKLGPQLKRLINQHRNTLTCALRKIVIKGKTNY